LIGDWILNLLLGLGLAEAFIRPALKFFAAGALATAVLVLTFFFIWLERKIVARIQDRLGPNRVGPYGLFQTLADALKLVTKEVIIPKEVDELPFVLAPLLAVMSVVGLWAVVPMAPTLIGSDINAGVLYIVSIGAVGTLGIMLAGMSSNNKYALLGAFRTVAMMLSFSIPMILTLLVPTILAGSMGMNEIVRSQQPVAFVFLAPLAALIFFISSLAEVGRPPFDLLEAESEIVAGFHIEYSGLAFGMFFVAEFLHAFTISALTATLFLGGWQGPGAEAAPILGFLYFIIKTAIVYFVVIWVRGTFPRIRIDQMNTLNWKILTPLSLALVVLTAIADKLALGSWWGRVGIHMGANALLLAVLLLALRAYARAERARQEGLAADVTSTAGAGD
jgi:NADH-quinone oxidoreductase subunit H